jgi:hypothetical protein
LYTRVFRVFVIALFIVYRLRMLFLIILPIERPPSDYVCYRHLNYFFSHVKHYFIVTIINYICISPPEHDDAFGCHNVASFGSVPTTSSMAMLYKYVQQSSSKYIDPPEIH